jgi:hypothetical protein
MTARTITLKDGRVVSVIMIEKRRGFVAACSRFCAPPLRATGSTEADAIEALKRKLEGDYD